LLCNFAKRSMLKEYEGFDFLESKHEKKNLMRAHIYLDALISLNRLPAQIQKPFDVLNEHIFKGIGIEAVRSILEKFCEV
jgi:hypothetical protein